MAISIVMPALEMAQETGKLVSWIKPEGATVAKGELILEIETDKAVMEIESPAAGVLAGIKAHPGDIVPVGQIIAWIVSPGEAPPKEEAQAASGRKLSAVSAPEGVSAVPAAASSATGPESRISPKARRLAKERGVDLSRLRGSGPDGEITTADVLAQAESASAPESGGSAPTGSAPASDAPLTSIARLMAERTTQSWTTVPHFFVTREVDAGALNAWREQLLPGIEQAHGVRLTHTDLLVALVARVLAKYHVMNASWVGDRIRTNADVNIALAMAVGEGVVGAVIHRADAATLGEVALQRRDLAERARAGRLRPTDIAGATFTISNLGMYRVDSFSAIITPPQAAVLAVGSIKDRVVPVDGQPGVRPIMSLTLSSDHRVVDGARAADFLDALAEAIHAPQGLIT
jgi:pyruvate dehydrogenase E2 component (dihydrolipoamide acetyltransferase)